ncbi:hypothetical protein [Streptomyces corynorhini]|uniref:Lipoprotein n=1 Tax=Streptomyces corynorhini TaxID=2282652 RepID=A0A370ANJ7_9ACTN|nr:hypothetical protein [Streptomyces corynorhini]RDG31168.1 hypothetical protein DVH02_33550 [Streptomyces corynorhini]
MRAISAPSAALLAVAALALTAPTATAAVDGGTTPFGFSVTPATVAPGGRVTLGVTNCASTATASSGVFDTVNIPAGRTALATVDWDAKPGAAYQVTFVCNGVTGRTDLRVSGATRAPSATPARTAVATATATARSTSTVVPSGVRGGLGGSVGVSAGELAAGAGLIAAAALGTAHVVRRRAGGRAH